MPNESTNLAEPIATAHRLGLDAEDLDEAVHTAKEDEAADFLNWGTTDPGEVYDKKSAEAADINNAGLDAQLTYLTSCNTLTDVAEILERIAVEKNSGARGPR